MRRCNILITSTPVDLVLTDIVMPGMDGLELLAHIHEHHKGTDVIVATGFHAKASYAEVIKAGATVINIPDTTGYVLTHEWGELIANVFKNVPNVKDAIISVHCHNDLGNAVGNSVAAILNGWTAVGYEVRSLPLAIALCIAYPLVLLPLGFYLPDERARLKRLVPLRG